MLGKHKEKMKKIMNILPKMPHTANNQPSRTYMKCYIYKYVTALGFRLNKNNTIITFKTGLG